MRQQGIKRSPEYLAKKIGLKYKKPKVRTRPNKNKGIPAGEKQLKANQKSAQRKIGMSYPIVKCTYCGKEGGSSSMPRWHFENCKHKR